MFPLPATVRHLGAAPNPLRALWLILPLAAGPAVAGALDGAGSAVRTTASTLAWAGWAIGLLAVLVPRTSTLTLARLLVPGGPVVAGWAAMQEPDVAGAAATVVALAAVVALWHPSTTDAFVDGSSYGAERRLSLRTPAAVAAGPAAVSWIVAAGGTVVGPLLVADGRAGVGVPLTVLGLAAVAWAARSLHTLSRRWLVFVPAGVVVHDPLVLVEPVLLQRHLLEVIGPASSDTEAVDLTGGALGLGFEIRSREPFGLGLRQGRGRIEVADVGAVLVMPSRPAVALEAARSNRLPVD